MIDGRRVEVCIPYGRRRTVSILMNYLRRDRPVIDRVNLWMNTDAEQAEDVAWAHEQEQTYPGWVRCVQRPVNGPVLRPKQLNTGFFYLTAQDPDTTYVRFDDDVVYVHPAYFRNMMDFRAADPRYLLVMGHIWNNATLSYLHQQAGHLDRSHGIVQSPWCMDPIAWQSPIFADYIHRVMLEHIAAGTVDDLLFGEPYPLTDGTRFSISNFVWRGFDAAAWGGATRNRDEEIFLTEEWPRETNRTNVVNGRALVVHYSFFGQRPFLDKTDILDQYRAVSEKALSDVYYDLLGAT